MPDTWHDVDTEQTRERRVGAWLILCVGVIGLGLGLWSMKGRFTSAFDKRTVYKTFEEIEQERLESLKTKDTDADEINDFDETYVYKTSPYLADSDSDGLSDKTELEKGTNPNCPEGKDCGLLGGAERLEISASGTLEADEAPTDAEREYIESLLNPTPEQVRVFLKQAGMSDEDLSGIDDATLLKMYTEALLEAQRERQLNQTQ